MSRLSSKKGIELVIGPKCGKMHAGFFSRFPFGADVRSCKPPVVWWHSVLRCAGRLTATGCPLLEANTRRVVHKHMEKQTFADLGLDPALVKAIAAIGFEQPSPIQAQAIPVALAGRDIVGQSQTGSGKTMAFGIPVVQRIDPSLRAIQALILCPTRELAMQVCSEIHKITECKGVRATPVYGGASYDRQIRALQSGAQIVVGTPGRVVDMMDRGLIKVDKLKTLVFDEADEMLDMGFRDEIDQVMEAVPTERQTIFFSATFDPRIRDLIRRFTKNPATITIEHKALTVPTIEQRYYEVQGRSKVEVLCRLLDMETPRLTIVFANTKRAVDDTVDALVARGYAADRLHGDLNQMMRERVMRNFRSGNVEVLVATDVAARGLDVNDVDLIVNFELPYDEEDYVHRIGRTGRAGRAGMAFSFVGGREIYLLQRIQRYINVRINRHKVPSQEEVEANRVDQTFEKIKAALENGAFTSHEATIQRLLDIGFTPTDISSAILDLWMKESGREGEQIMEDRPAKGKAAQQQRPQREFVPREFTPREPKPAYQPTPKPVVQQPAVAEVQATPSVAAEASKEAIFAAAPVEQAAESQPVESTAVETPASASPIDEATLLSPSESVANPPVESATETAHVEEPARNEAKEEPAIEQARKPAPRFEPEPREDDFGDVPRRSRSFVQKGPRSGMVRLFINLGSMDHTRPGDIAGLVYNTAKIPPGTIGTIDVFEKCSYIEVPEDHVETVMSTVTGATVRGRSVRMDFADRQESSGERPRRSFGPPQRRFEGGGGAGGPRRFDGPPRRSFGDDRPPFKKRFGGGGGHGDRDDRGGAGGYGGGGNRPFKGRPKY